MPLCKITLSYNGTDLHGWQIQPNLPTVQGHLAAALHRLLGESTLPQGSGRTDAGVHALAQVASVAIHSTIPAPSLHRALNRTLPASIRILSVQFVDPPFHARHSAHSKTYEYRIFLRRPLDFSDPKAPDCICPPFLAPFVWDYPRPLSLDLLNQSAAHLLGTHDFTSFAASRTAAPEPYTPADPLPGYPTTPPSPCRTITHSLWTHDPARNLFIYRITGSGFLYHMVRNIVGTLTLCGSNRLPMTAVPGILAARRRSAAGPTAPAQGLFLAEVHYP